MEINWTNRKTFLVSLGFVLIFYGMLLFFANGIFVTQRVDALAQVIISNNTEARKLYDQTYPDLLLTNNLIMYFSVILVIVGVIIALFGLFMNENPILPRGSGSSRPAPTSRTRPRFNLINEITELWNAGNGLIAELLLITGSIIFGNYMAEHLGLGPLWAIGMVVAALAIKRYMDEGH